MPDAEAFVHQDTYDQPPPVESARAPRYNHGGMPYHGGGAPVGYDPRTPGTHFDGYGGRGMSTHRRTNSAPSPLQQYGGPAPPPDLNRIYRPNLSKLVDGRGQLHDPCNGPVAYPLFHQDSGRPFDPDSAERYLMDGGHHQLHDHRVHYHFNYQLITADGGSAGSVHQYVLQAPPPSSRRLLRSQDHDAPGIAASSHGGSLRPLNFGGSSSQGSAPGETVEDTKSSKAYVARSVIPASSLTTSDTVEYILPEKLLDFMEPRALESFFHRVHSAANGDDDLKRQVNRELDRLEELVERTGKTITTLLEECYNGKQKHQVFRNAEVSALEEEEVEGIIQFKTKIAKKKKATHDKYDKFDSVKDSDIDMLLPAQTFVEGAKVFSVLFSLKAMKDIIDSWRPGTALLRNPDWLLKPDVCILLIDKVIPKATLYNFAMLDFAIMAGFTSLDDMASLSRHHHLGGLQLLTLLQVHSKFPNYKADVENHKKAGVVCREWKVQFNQKASDLVLKENFCISHGGAYLNPESKNGPVRFSINKTCSPFGEGEQKLTYRERFLLAQKITGRGIPSTDGFVVDRSEGHAQPTLSPKPAVVGMPSNPGNSETQDGKPVPEPPVVPTPSPPSNPTTEDDNPTTEDPGHEVGTPDHSKPTVSNSGGGQDDDSEITDDTPPPPAQAVTFDDDQAVNTSPPKAVTVDNDQSVNTSPPQVVTVEDDQSVNTSVMLDTVSPTIPKKATSTGSGGSPIKNEGHFLEPNFLIWLKEITHFHFTVFEQQDPVKLDPSYYVLGADGAGYMYQFYDQCWNAVYAEVIGLPDMDKSTMALIQEKVKGLWMEDAEAFTKNHQPGEH